MPDPARQRAVRVRRHAEPAAARRPACMVLAAANDNRPPYRRTVLAMATVAILAVAAGTALALF